MVDGGNLVILVLTCTLWRFASHTKCSQDNTRRHLQPKRQENPNGENCFHLRLLCAFPLCHLSVARTTCGHFADYHEMWLRRLFLPPPLSVAFQVFKQLRKKKWRHRPMRRIRNVCEIRRNDTKNVTCNRLLEQTKQTTAIRMTLSQDRLTRTTTASTTTTVTIWKSRKENKQTNKQNTQHRKNHNTKYCHSLCSAIRLAAFLLSLSYSIVCMLY